MLFRSAPGRTLTLPLGGRTQPVYVRGVWRDYARQFGAIAMDTADYRALTGDTRVNDLAIWLQPGATPAEVQGRVRALLPDPGALGKAYADLFRQRGGRFVAADARKLESVHDGWRLATGDGAIQARDAVVALGPWSNDILRPLNLELPLIGKRGYHKHYAALGNAALSRPVLDVDGGYVLAPMARGIRLTTGAEFARFDAPPTPIQIEKTEPLARIGRAHV